MEILFLSIPSARYTDKADGPPGLMNTAPLPANEARKKYSGVPATPPPFSAVLIANTARR
jgi:hypothetical protein